MLSLAEQLDPIALEVNGGVTTLFDTLVQPFDDRAALYTRLVDLRLPTLFAIQLDKAQRIAPPPDAEAELDRYVRFVGELLLASENLDAAIATEDPVAVARAAVEIEVSSGALAVVLPSSSCVTLVPDLTRDLCSRAGLSEYETALDYEIRRFVASFRPAFRIPATFGDVVRARALGSLQAEATLVLQNTATRLAALEPGAAYGRLHAILLDYFPAAAEAWSRFPADPDGTDPLLYAFIADSLEAIRDDTRDALDPEYDIVLAANSGSQIVQILGIWFDPTPAATG